MITYLIANLEHVAETEGVLLSLLYHVYVLQHAVRHLPRHRQVVSALQ